MATRSLRISRKSLSAEVLELLNELEAMTGAEITLIRETDRYFPYRCTLHFANSSQAYYGDSVADAIREAKRRLDDKQSRTA